MTLQLGDLQKHSGASALLWIDLETTGTDRRVDEVIEVGAILTDFEFEQIGSPFTQVAQPSASGLGRLMLTPVVREMHITNGLLDEIVCEACPDIIEAESAMLRWLNLTWNSKKQRGPIEKFRFILAGSGVGHFDRDFIRKYMPRIDELLIFSPLDVGNVRRFLRMCNVQFPAAASSQNKNHRALDDIRQHLEEAKFYRERLLDEFVRS